MLFMMIIGVVIGLIAGLCRSIIFNLVGSGLLAAGAHSYFQLSGWQTIAVFIVFFIFCLVLGFARRGDSDAGDWFDFGGDSDGGSSCSSD